MESQKEIKEEQARIKQEYVTHRHLDAVIPQLQKTMDEVRGDIKKILTIVHSSNGKKTTEPN